ncbi:MAG: hypothetical protein H9893_14295 [Candidatus Niameybacter stercoravium]|nr:hypothetical protein [Candidatus Niameybacter stercoravium]
MYRYEDYTKQHCAIKPIVKEVRMYENNFVSCNGENQFIIPRSVQPFKSAGNLYRDGMVLRTMYFYSSGSCLHT